MRSLESKLAIASDQMDAFRRHIMTTVGALALEGRTFDYDTDPQIQRAIEIVLAEEATQLELHALREQARQALAASNYLAAVEALDRLLHQTPGDVQALQDRGLARLHLLANREAISDLSAALAVEPDNDWLAYHRGVAYYAAEEWARAIPDLERGLNLTLQEQEVWRQDAEDKLARARAKKVQNAERGGAEEEATGPVVDQGSIDTPETNSGPQSLGFVDSTIGANEAARIECICTKCFQIYAGKIKIGAEMKCTSCGAMFTVAPFYGKMLQTADWLSWIAGRKCLKCSSRRSHSLGVKRNEVLLQNGKWKIWDWNYRRCDNCGSTWIVQ